MGELDILKTIVLPTLECVVEFEPVHPWPLKYKVTVMNGAHTVEVETSETICRLPYLRYGQNYTAKVEAVFEDEVNNIAGLEKQFSTAIQTTNARLIRQAICDIIARGNIVEDERNLNIISDKWGQPRIVSEDSNSVNFPFVEIELPIIRQSQPVTRARYEEVYEVPIFIMDSCGEPDTGTERIDFLFTKIRQVVNASNCLNLAHLSVVDKSWQWRGDEPEFGEQTVGIEVRLIVTVPQINIGRLPYQS